MNLHKEEHEIIKQSIAKALFYLMEKKTFSDITVTELINKAGIARATYYRNYISKETVLEEYIDDILLKFNEEYPVKSISDRFSSPHILHVLDYVSRYQKELKILHKSGLSSIYLDRINNYLLKMISTHSYSVEEKFDLYAFAGAEFNIIFNWLISDMKESPNTIAEYIVSHR